MPACQSSSFKSKSKNGSLWRGAPSAETCPDEARLPSPHTRLGGEKRAAFQWKRPVSASRISAGIHPLLKRPCSIKTRRMAVTMFSVQHGGASRISGFSRVLQRSGHGKRGPHRRRFRAVWRSCQISNWSLRLHFRKIGSSNLMLMGTWFLLFYRRVSGFFFQPEGSNAWCCCR